MHHRLFECGFTAELREDSFAESDLEWLRHNKHVEVLLQGLQEVAYIPDGRHYGAGHEQEYVETWTLTGQPVGEIVQGVVFSDGSCKKHGTPAGRWQAGRP